MEDSRSKPKHGGVGLSPLPGSVIPAAAFAPGGKNRRPFAGSVLLAIAIMLLSTGCSENSSPTGSGASPRITQLDTFDPQSIGYYGTVNMVFVHRVAGNRIGPVYVNCGAWQGGLFAAGGHPPYSFAGSGLPGDMQVVSSGTLFWNAPCSAAGQSLTASLTVSDSKGAQSAPVIVTFVVQTNGT